MIIITDPHTKNIIVKRIFKEENVLSDFPGLMSITRQDFQLAWQDYGEGVENLYKCLQLILPVVSAQYLSEILLWFLDKHVTLKDLQVIQHSQTVWRFFVDNILTLDDKGFGRLLSSIILSKFPKGTKIKRVIFVDDDLFLRSFMAFRNQVDAVNTSVNLKSLVLIFVFCLNEKLLYHSWGITMFCRLFFSTVEAELHQDNASYAAKIMSEFGGLMNKYLSEHVHQKQFVCNLFTKQAEAWYVESVICDLFKLIVTFVPLQPAHIFSYNQQLYKQLELQVSQILQSFAKLHHMKYLCLLHGLLMNIKTMFEQDYFKPNKRSGAIFIPAKSSAQPNEFFQHQKTKYQTIRRRLAFIAESNWIDVYKQIQQQVTTGKQKMQKMTTDQLIAAINQQIQAGTIEPNMLGIMQDHIRLLQLTQKYNQEILSESSLPEFLFLQQHIRTHFYQYYIPYYQPEYVQQLMQRYNIVIGIIDKFMSEKLAPGVGEQCKQFVAEIQVPIELSNYYTLFKLLPAFDSVDFDLYDIKGDDMWCQPHFSQQGLNEIFSFVDATRIQDSVVGETVLNQTHYDLFHLSRTWCKHSYRDYKQMCDQVQSCTSAMSEQQKKEYLYVVRQCINKRDLYGRFCVYQPDQGHAEQLKQLEKTESGCVKSLKT
jgi:hypothetical protein